MAKSLQFPINGRPPENKTSPSSSSDLSFGGFIADDQNSLVKLVDDDNVQENVFSDSDDTTGNPSGNNFEVNTQQNSTSPVPPSLPIDSSSKEIRHRFYPANYVGDLICYIRRTNPNTPMNFLKIYKYLEPKYRSIIKIVPLNKNKLRVECKSVEEINTLSIDDKLNEYYHVYIPAINVEVYGTIFAPLDTSVEEIMDTGVGKFKDNRLPAVTIVHAHRNQYRNENNVLVPSESMRITFSGKVIPHYVQIGQLLIRVKPSISKIFYCTNCQQYNHTSGHCARKTVCGKCNEHHPTANCPTSGVQNCIDCEGDHSTGSYDCPKYKQILEKKKKSVISRSQKSYASIVKSFVDQHEPDPGNIDISLSAGDDFIADLSNPSRKRKRYSHSANKIYSDRSQKNIRKPDPNNKNYQPPPGFQKIAGFEKCIKEIVLNLCAQLSFPEWLLSFIEQYAVPVLSSLWKSVQQCISSVKLTNQHDK